MFEKLSAAVGFFATSWAAATIFADRCPPPIQIYEFDLLPKTGLRSNKVKFFRTGRHEADSRTPHIRINASLPSAAEKHPQLDVPVLRLPRKEVREISGSSALRKSSVGGLQTASFIQAATCDNFSKCHFRARFHAKPGPHASDIAVFNRRHLLAPVRV